MKKSIDLDLSKRCVRTEIRRTYNQAVNDFFGSEENEGLATRIEFLKAVLEQVDLEGLRGRFPDLAAGSRSRVRLEWLETGEMRLLLEDRVIHAQLLQP